MVNAKTYARSKAIGGELYEKLKDINKRQSYGRRYRVPWQMIQYDRQAGPPRPQHKQQTKMNTRVCPWCMVQFTTKYANKICCSKYCKDARKQGVLHRYPPKPLANQRIVNRPSCRICESSVPLRRRTYCSEYCAYLGNIENAAEQMHRRRTPARALGDRGITITRLIKRDGPRCYLCNRVTTNNKKTSRGKRPKLMATIDHVIPIAQGGTHTWANVRVACWNCNAKKSARVLNVYEPTLFEVA